MVGAGVRDLGFGLRACEPFGFELVSISCAFQNTDATSLVMLGSDTSLGLLEDAMHRYAGLKASVPSQV